MHRRWSVAAGLFPILIICLWGILGDIPLRDGAVRDALIRFSTLLFIASYPLVLAHLALGALEGFPRWSYASLLLAPLLALYLSNVTTPGFELFGVPIFGRELWGWRAWAPFAAALLVTALIYALRRRSGRGLQPNPLAALGRGLWIDGSRLAFAVYGLLPFCAVIAMDEVGDAYVLPGMLLATLFLAGGAYLYLRSPEPRPNGSVLMAAAFLGMFTSMAVSQYYWDTHDVDMTTFMVTPKPGPAPWGSILWLPVMPALVLSVIVALPLLPGMIRRWADGIEARRAASGS